MRLSVNFLLKRKIYAGQAYCQGQNQIAQIAAAIPTANWTKPIKTCLRCWAVM